LSDGPEAQTHEPDEAPRQPEDSHAAGGDEARSWRPADYYASDPPKPRFPRWVPLSCGVAALIALVGMFAIGMFLRTGGLSSFVALAIGQFQGEMKGMLDEDVDASSKERLDETLRGIREGLTSGSLAQGDVLPLLQEIQKVTRDRKVTTEEIEALQKIADEIGAEQDGAAEPVEL